MKKTLFLLFYCLCSLGLRLESEVSCRLYDHWQLPPWVAFTELEQRLENIVLEVHHNGGDFSEFYDFQQGEIPRGVSYITRHMPSRRSNTVEKLSQALRADANYAIDIAIAFTTSKGTINKKTEAIFTRWNRANYRLYRSLTALFPHINSQRLAVLLKSRIGELYYLAKALGSTENERHREKHVEEVILHSAISLEYAFELDKLIEGELMRTIPPDCQNNYSRGSAGDSE